MRIPRVSRLAAACRPLVPLFVSSVFLIAHTATAAVRTGTVVDASGQALPRAFVRVLDERGAELHSEFADEGGRFEVPAATSCHVEASLTGFKTTTVACGSAPQLRIMLPVAPIEESVIVSATRTDAPSSQVGASATVFTRADLERRQTPLLAQLLDGTPGAMVVRSGAPGALTSLFVRGGESDYNKVLLDGVPLNEPGGSFYFNNLTTENLERVEIVRGAYSSLFGTDAMSSVIQLFTRRGDREQHRPRVTAQIDGGTYGTLHTIAGVAGAASRADYSFSVARLNSDNRAPNSRLENTTLSANAGVALTDTATLRFIGRGELEHVGTPGTTAFGRADLDAFFERHDAIGSVSFDQRMGRAFHQRASYSLAASNQQSTNLVLDPPYRAVFEGRVASRVSTDFLNDSTTALRRHHAEYQADLRLASGGTHGEQLLTVLGDWDGERATAENRVFVSRTMNARDNFGAAAQQQMLWRRLFVTVGARIERNQNFGTAAVPRGTVVFVAREGEGAVGETRLRASAGIGIKEPTMLESYSLSPFFRGNPNLEPERSRSAEIGVEQRFAHDRAKFELTYFDNRYRNIISLMTTDPTTFEAQFANVGLTRARGLEAGFRASPVHAIQVRGGYTLLASRILASATPDDPIFGLGHEAFRRPRHSGFAGLTVNWNRIVGDLNGVFIGHFVDSDFGLFDPPLTRNPGHQTWDARLNVTVTRQVIGTFAIDNLTNRDYSEPFGYQPLRRAVRAGVRVGF